MHPQRQLEIVPLQVEAGIPREQRPPVVHLPQHDGQLVRARLGQALHHAEAKPELAVKGAKALNVVVPKLMKANQEKPFIGIMERCDAVGLLVSVAGCCTLQR